MKDAESKFISFLKEKKVFEEFIARFNSQGGGEFDAWLEAAKFEDYADSAFFWGPDGGHGKWQKIALGWREYVELDGAK